MRVLASAVAIAVVAGASAVPARDAVAQASSSGAQQSGKVLVIPAKPTVRARVSQWLSSWQANGGEVKGEAVRAAGSDPQPKAKKPRRTAAKKPVKSARKAKQQQTASRTAKRSLDTPKPAAGGTPAEASPPAVAAAPAVAPPGPPPQASVQVAPAYAAPPQVRRVPPSQTLHTPLADIPPVTLFVPPAVVGAAAATPAPAAVAALPPVATPEPKPAVPEPPLPPATSRIHKQAETTDEATWWRTEGEPAIVNFRDCIAAYAGREAPRRPQTSLGDLVIEAGAGDCRAPFEDMMTTLTVRYGRERLETAMGAILNETLLPAARAAADEASRSAGATDAAP